MAAVAYWKRLLSFAPASPLPCLLCPTNLQVTYIPEDRLFRFSAKLFNCTPDQLPTDLKASLINMLTCNSLEGYIRPG